MTTTASASDAATRRSSAVNIACYIQVALTGCFTSVILPMVINAVIEGFRLSAAQGGYISAAEMGGMAAGALLTGSLIQRLRPRTAVVMGAAIALLTNVLSTFTPVYDLLLAIRFVAGLSNGSLLALASASIGATKKPDRNFALFTTVVYAVSTLAFKALPPVIAAHGVEALFATMAGLAGLALISAVRFSSKPPMVTAHCAAHPTHPASGRTATILLWVAGLGVLAFFIGMGGAWGYLARVGLDLGVSHESVSTTLAMTQATGLLGAIAASFAGPFLGRRVYLAIGSVGTILSLAWLGLSPTATVFAIAPLTFVLFMAFVQPFMQGGVSALDPSGRLVAMSFGLMDVGLSIGPLIAGLLMGFGGILVSLWVGAAGTLVALVLLWIAFRSIDVRRRTQPRQPAKQPAV